MNPDVKTKWLEALRDPKRKQTLGQLKDDSGECCLGVLCDVAVKSGVAVEVNVRNLIGNKFYLFDGQHGVLPFSVMDWAGLESSDPLVTYGGKVNISEVNDFGASFAKIADIIEEQL